MNNTISHTSDTEKRKKKRFFAIILLALACLFAIGIVAAYFSDMFEISGDFSSGNLQINATYNFTLNGVPTQIQDIQNLNPGDVVVVSGQVVNEGNQSAWIREKISFGNLALNVLPYFKVYGIALTQADLLSTNNYSEFAMPISAAGIAVSANRVIDGYGDDAQLPRGQNYNYINANNYTFAITIYFMHTAPNEAQNQLFTLKVATQALQFINNNIDEPDEGAWGDVSAAL